MTPFDLTQWWRCEALARECGIVITVQARDCGDTFCLSNRRGLELICLLEIKDVFTFMDGYKAAIEDMATR